MTQEPETPKPGGEPDRPPLETPRDLAAKDEGGGPEVAGGPSDGPKTSGGAGPKGGAAAP